MREGGVGYEWSGNFFGGTMFCTCELCACLGNVILAVGSCFYHLNFIIMLRSGTAQYKYISMSFVEGKGRMMRVADKTL